MITKIKRELKPLDIVDQVKHNNTSKLHPIQKAEVILANIQEDKSLRTIAKEKNLDYKTPQRIIKENKELINQIVSRQTELKESVRNKYLRLLNRKSSLLNDNKKLDRSKPTELSQVVKDLDTLIRLDKGEPTTISQYEAKTEEQLKLETIELLEAIKSDDKLKLLRLVFNKE